MRQKHSFQGSGSQLNGFTLSCRRTNTWESQETGTTNHALMVEGTHFIFSGLQEDQKTNLTYTPVDEKENLVVSLSLVLQPCHQGPTSSACFS